MELMQDLFAAIGVVLNGLPQGLLALTYGFASVPTALGFLIGAVACAVLGSVAPISFQAETIVLAGTMGKDIRERLSMIFFGGVLMTVMGFTGLLTRITDGLISHGAKKILFLNGHGGNIPTLNRVCVELSKKGVVGVQLNWA